MRKGFHIFSESCWFRRFDYPGMIEELMIGDYPEEGGTHGEFNIRFYDFTKYPELSIFGDAFATFNAMEDFKQFLFAKENEKINKDQFIQGLKDLGFIDLTERTR